MEEKIADNYVNYLVNHIVPKSMTLHEIEMATLNDPLLQKVRECIRSGKWDKTDTHLTPYRVCADELSIASNVILRGTRIVIPQALQDTATKLGHVGHQGIEKTKALLREKIWYPGMNSKVKTMIENCIACQAVGPDNPPSQCASHPHQLNHGKV